ncbi:MAG TPA: TonB-dependent receptor [Candidatus Acidoferrum sp.]|nr:TonB-dependent receptor [Candidatus Acidoferrum sp.]
MKRFLPLLLLSGVSIYAQSNMGELRLKISDPANLGVRAVVVLICEANQFHESYSTDAAGKLTAKRLPFGLYKIEIRRDGFVPVTETLEIRSVVPTEFATRLNLVSAADSIIVSDYETLIDPHSVGNTQHLGLETIEKRPASIPGRSLQDLVNSQPGWLYEGDAVLHPRGSEYQTQVVVDGIPLLDNRSPGSGPEIEADNLDSVGVYTATFPAEYGRQLGGVVELNTARDTRAGVHGEVVLSGGSFATAAGYAMAQYLWGKNTLGVSASGDMTSHYLNPVVPENFTNTGTTADFSIRYERDLSSADRISFSVRHELARYEIPNELVQQTPHENFIDPSGPPGSQLQNAGNFETMGIVSYQHIFSPNVVLDVRGMVRDNSNSLQSNPYSLPVIANQQNYFREGYFKGSLSIHRNLNEIKVGVESDNIFLHENFNYFITEPSQFDPGTPQTFSFMDSKPELDQAAFIQDQIRLGNWTISAGLRWDHYQLIVNQNAVSPRLGVAKFFPSWNLVLHASYDRIFQTPSFRNILLSSSPEVISLNPEVLRLPVRPSLGNFYEVGASKAFFGQLRLEGTVFSRRMNNYADDDQLLSTAVSFPIAFAKASIYGAEAKIEVPHWRQWSGFVSYSYIVGSAYLPATGGLFLGTDATNALDNITGRFWDSQDQRNTVRMRVRYEFTNRIWAGFGMEYGSGLPFEFSGTEAQALAQYGPQVISRVNFALSRIRPSFSIGASIGAEIWKSDSLSMRLQADAVNLNNQLNVIDFAGLFSGNAIGPSRSFSLRLTTNF